MNEFVNRKECMERYCPIVCKNVLIDVTQSGSGKEATVKVCCHHYNECKSCYGKCANIYASPAAEAVVRTTSCIQGHSW